jgi:chemotaxis protein MotB
MRKKKHPAHENHERWLVSYADFITLLFAFFVVMFATSQADKGKAKQVSESVKTAFESSKLTSVVASILGGTVDDKGSGNAQIKGPGGQKPKNEKTKDLQDQEEDNKPPRVPPGEKPVDTIALRALSAELKKEIETGQIQVSMEARGLAVSFKEAAAFPSGTDEITPDVYPSIAKVAAVIKRISNPVRLEGHTDSIPIHNPRFKSNWDLSAARSISMLELLSNRFAIPRERMSVGGYAETAPADTNTTSEGRARNRRVDIIILNEVGLLGEPSSHVEGAIKPSPAR